MYRIMRKMKISRFKFRKYVPVALYNDLYDGYYTLDTYENPNCDVEVYDQATKEKRS